MDCLPSELHKYVMCAQHNYVGTYYVVYQVDTHVNVYKNVPVALKIFSAVAY